MSILSMLRQADEYKKSLAKKGLSYLSNQAKNTASYFNPLTKGGSPFLQQGSQLTKEMVQAPGRALTSVALPAAQGALRLAGKKPAAEYQPKGSLEKLILGDRPINSMANRITESQKETAKTLGGSKLAQGASLVLAPLGLAGMTALDITPMGAGEKKLAEKIAAEKAAPKIFEMLSKAYKGADKDSLDNLAKKLTTVNKPEEVSNWLKTLTQKTDPQKETNILPINTNTFNLTYLEKKKIYDTTEAIRPELEQTIGKPLTHEEVLEAAKNSEILTRATSREQTLQRTATLERTKQHIAEMAKGEVTPDFLKSLQVLREEYANLGRQLNSVGIKSNPELYSNKTELIKDIMDTGAKLEDIEKAAKGVDFNDLNQVTKFYREFVKPKAGEILDEYRYINLLSSPRTHIVNSFSNLVQTAVLNPATRLVSGGVDMIGSAITGNARKVYAREVPTYYKGLINSIGNASGEFLKTLQGKNFLQRPDISNIPTGSKITKPLMFIPRLLEASDVFFRTLIEGAEKESIAKRYIKQVKTIDEATMAKITQEAQDKANYYVFRKALDPSNASGQGALLSSIDKATNAVYSLRKVPGVRWFIPFVQTPMNILKQGIEYSPLGLGTLAKNTNKTEQIAKSLIGSTVMAGAATMAFQGNATWKAPTNEQDKAIFYASGRKPYSIKIGDNWVSYSKLGPLAYPIAMAAALNWYLKENPKSDTEATEKKLTSVISGIAQFFSDQSYVQGMNNILQLASNPAAITNVMSELPQQLVPLVSLNRWITQLIDNTYKNPEGGGSIKGIFQKLASGLPGLSQMVPNQVSPEGEVQKRNRLSSFLPVDISNINNKYETIYQIRQDEKRASYNRDKAKEDFKPIYEEIQTLIKDNKIDTAQEMVDNLSDDEYEYYKSLKTSDTRTTTNKNKIEIYPIYKQIQELVISGDSKKAQEMLDGLTDDQYKAYQSLKKSLR